MSKFIKIEKTIINLDSIAYAGAMAKLDANGKMGYWQCFIKLNDGECLDYYQANDEATAQECIDDLYSKIERQSSVHKP